MLSKVRQNEIKPKAGRLWGSSAERNYGETSHLLDRPCTSYSDRKSPRISPKMRYDYIMLFHQNQWNYTSDALNIDSTTAALRSFPNAK